MRLKDKEITDTNEMQKIIKKAQVCRMGLSDEGRPYIVPMCFGYGNDTVYFHCAAQGMKIDILRGNPQVCLEFEADITLESSDKACDWDMHYKSVIAFGKAEFVTDLAEKKKALGLLMGQYSDTTFEFPEQAVKHITIIKVPITEMTGKKT